MFVTSRASQDQNEDMFSRQVRELQQEPPATKDGIVVEFGEDPDMDDTLLAEDGLAKDDAIARSPPPDMDDMLSKYFYRYGEQQL